MKIDPPKLPDNTRRKPMQVISSKTPTSTTTSQETSASLAAAGKTRVQISRKFGEGATAYDVVEEQRIISEVFCALNPTEAIFIETCSDGRFFLANDRISPDTKMEGIILEHKLDAQGTEVLTIINYSDRHIKIANVIPISPYNSFETGWYVTSPSLFDSSEIHWGQNFEHCFNIPFISSKTPLPAATLILMRKRHLESNDPRFLKIKVPDLTNAQILALVKEYGSISDTYGGIPCAYESDPAALDSIQHECITPMFPGECESVRTATRRSIPSPQPAAGGIPYSSASTKSSSICWASSSPLARFSSWASNLARWSCGSFSSE